MKLKSFVLALCIVATGILCSLLKVRESFSQQSQVPILVTYPRNGACVQANSTFLIGACLPGSKLMVNTSPVKLNSQGFFAHIVRLKPGINKFVFALTDNKDKTVVLSVKHPMPDKILPSGPLKILQGSLEPKEDMGLAPGDVITFAARATPGSKMQVLLGKHKLSLYPLVLRGRPRLAVNQGLDAVYGMSYQKTRAAYPDLYSSLYRVTAADVWQDVRPVFLLTKGAKSLRLVAPQKLRIIQQPLLGVTNHDNTVVRLGPGLARVTPLPAEVRLMVDGFKGNYWRCEASPKHHVWIKKDDLSVSDIPAQLPVSLVQTINIETKPQETLITIPLNQRLPYQIEQQINPSRLVIKIFGAIADTDWIAPKPGGSLNTDLKMPQTNKASKSVHNAWHKGSNLDLVDYVTWNQPEDYVYQVTVNLSLKQQWGFWADYHGTNLVLHVKAPPAAQTRFPGITAGTCQGLIICLDPGHGGKETGSIGCSGIPESQVNLAIASELKKMLEREGATVVTTRNRDNKNASLVERVAIAEAAKADLLISIHNNALPDGRDPWVEHGTSSYWYHPQAIVLAQDLKRAVVQELGFPDYGTRYQNLALCRTSKALAVLIEIGFMIHPDEYAKLIDPQMQKRAAKGLLKGIQNFILKTNAPT